MNEDVMDKVLELCKENPEMAKVFDVLMQGSQSAAAVGFTMEQVANICTVGFMIGSDPQLGEMVKNIAAITKMGLDIVDK